MPLVTAVWQLTAVFVFHTFDTFPPQLPQMLEKLTSNNPEQLECGIEKLISYGPLLDLVDTKYKSVSFFY